MAECFDRVKYSGAAKMINEHGEYTCVMESNFCWTSIQVLLRDASSLLPSSDATEPSRESQSNFGATAASAKYRCCCQLHCLNCGTHILEI